MKLTRTRIGGAVALGLAALGVLAAAPVQAGSLVLGNSGWRATWDSSFDSADGTSVTLTVLAETSQAVVLQKVAVFADGPDQYGLIAPVEINFEQISPTAVADIVITSESLTNASGVDWSGFKFIIEDGTTNTAADTSFDLLRTFGTPPPFNVSPFQVVDTGGITDQPQTITLGDGILANGQVWRPGVGPVGGELVIHAAPSQVGTQRFILKEQPIPAAVPLPAAVWMGLSGLGMAVIAGGLKNRRKHA